jgi:HEAT repeat protein
MSVTEELVSLLESPSSPKRRSAAKKLRKIGDLRAGPALLIALKRELPDKRTLETQYQMIMAFGHCGYKEAIPLVHILAHERFEHTMVLVAVGDTYVRLSRTSEDDPNPLFDVFAVRNDDALLDGALRAVAMLRMKFTEVCAAKVIEHIEARKQEFSRFWVVAACPGWSGPSVEKFLDQCVLSGREDIRSAAMAAKLKKYLKWNPL